MKIGILGGGQLAQMLAQAGSSLGMEFAFFSSDPKACAAPFGQHICSSFDDAEAKQRLAGWAQVITYEFENIPAELVASLEQQVELHPSSTALTLAADRLLEKRRFQKLDISSAGFMPVDCLADLEKAIDAIGLPAILKTRTQGYDGKGQAVLERHADLAAAWQRLGEVPCIVESMVNFSREVSIIAVRSTTGEMVFYPLTENYHREGILRLSLSRRDDAMQPQAEGLIRRLLDDLDYVGVLTLELFQVDDKLYANEMAPRVHNSGHWTIEGAKTSQFENHLRAICGLPLGVTEAPAAAAMVNLVGRLPDAATIQAIPGATLHAYGKQERPGRKVGHITLIDETGGESAFSERLSDLLEQVGEHELAVQVRNGLGSTQQPY